MKGKTIVLIGLLLGLGVGGVLWWSFTRLSNDSSESARRRGLSDPTSCRFLHLAGPIVSKDTVSAIALAPDGSSLAIADASGAVTIHNPASTDQGPRLQLASAVVAMRYSPDGGRLGCVSENGLVTLIDPAAGTKLQQAQIPTANVASAGIGPDLSTVVAISVDNVMRRGRLGSDGIDVLAEKPMAARNVIPYTSSWGNRKRLLAWQLPTRYAFSDDLSVFAGGDSHEHSRGWVCIWDTKRAAALADIENKVGIDDDTIAPINALAFSPDGSHIVVGTSRGSKVYTSDDGLLSVWSITDSKQVLSFYGHEQGVYALAYVPDGSRIASCARDGTIRLWDASTGTMIQSIRAGNEPVRLLTFSSNGQYMAGMIDDRRVHVWRADKLQGNFKAHCELADEMYSSLLHEVESRLLGAGLLYTRYADFGSVRGFEKIGPRRYKVFTTRSTYPSGVKEIEVFPVYTAPEFLKLVENRRLQEAIEEGKLAAMALVTTKTGGYMPSHTTAYLVREDDGQFHWNFVIRPLSSYNYWMKILRAVYSRVPEEDFISYADRCPVLNAQIFRSEAPAQTASPANRVPTTAPRSYRYR